MGTAFTGTCEQQLEGWWPAGGLESDIPKPEPEWLPADSWPRPMVLDAQSYLSFPAS